MHNQEKSITFAVENVRKTDDLRVMIVRKTDKIIDEHYQKTGKGDISYLFPRFVGPNLMNANALVNVDVNESEIKWQLG